ncbi:hypothetical protein [Cyanobium sp. CH-040]|uniref:hypothetical protein n=1 Tax=Cyanobium sp. CH-040 TaxID=2823708 RepID=UPI0020CEEC36|nr:hypothetical protein [Cyanobium sp. CH-040]MCP9927182.1 hypothetical protein [Cyanobium sp. CH-040]
MSTLNWRRDPDVEMRLAEARKQAEQLRKDNAILAWIESELDLIEAGLPSSSTPAPTTDASSNDC